MRPDITVEASVDETVQFMALSEYIIKDGTVAAVA
jgi:hypothetical protein